MALPIELVVFVLVEVNDDSPLLLLYYIAERLASDTTEGGNNTTEHITRLHHLSLSTTIDTTIIFIHHLV